MFGSIGDCNLKIEVYVDAANESWIVLPKVRVLMIDERERIAESSRELHVNRFFWGRNRA